MKVSLEEKKIEAVKRMKALGIFSETIRQFEKENLVSVSVSPFGGFFWIDDEDKERIAAFEKKSSALVYMVVRSYTDYGKMDSYLFVSDFKDEEWAMDREDLKHGRAFAYVYNYEEPEFSEFGTIGIKKTIAAGLERIW